MQVQLQQHQVKNAPEIAKTKNVITIASPVAKLITKYESPKLETQVMPPGSCASAFT